MSSDVMPDMPNSVLFVCYLNAVRSPMAEGLMKKRHGRSLYVQSAGMNSGDLDDFMVTVMAEQGVDMSAHRSRKMAELGDTNFDLAIAFTEDAADAARAMFEGTDTVIETWIMPNPVTGSLDVRAMLNNYRATRDYIDNKLVERFGENTTL